MNGSLVTPQKHRLLIIANTQTSGQALSALVDRAPVEIVHVQAASAQAAAAVGVRPSDLILVDGDNPDLSPAAALQALLAAQPAARIVLLTAQTSVRAAVELMRLGACAVVETNDGEQLVAVVNQELARIRSGVAELTAPAPSNGGAPAASAHLFDILNVIEDAVMAVSLQDRRTVLVNHAFARIFGYPAEYFVQNPGAFSTVVHPDDLAQATAAMEACLQNGSAEIEHRIVWPDGQVRWVQRHAWLSYDDRGRPNELISVSRDITAQKQGEDALRESEETYRLTLSNISDAVFITDDAGEFTFICPNIQILLGYTREEVAAWGNIARVLGTGLFDRATLARQGEIANIAWNVEDKAGNRYDVLVSVKQVAVGRGTTLYTVHNVTELRQMENALRETDRRLRSVLEHIQDVVWSVDVPSFQIRYLNPAVRRVYGRTEQEFYAHGELWTEVIHPEDAGRSQEFNDMLLLHGTRDVEYRILRPDGEVRWLHDRAWGVYDEQGQLAGIEGIAIDITERKRVEAALWESMEQYRSLIDSSDAAIMMLDPNGVYLYFNPIAAAPFGDPEALVGKTVFDLIPDQADLILADARKVIASGVGAVVEQEITVAGQRHWYRTSIQPVRDDKGAPYAVMIHAGEITAQKEAEHKTLAQNAILQQAHDLMAMADLDGRLTFINRAGAEMIGVASPDLLIGEPIDGFHLPEDAALVLGTYVPEVLRRGYWRGENRLLRKDGQLVPVDQTIFPIRDPQGNIVQTASIMVDITERKQAEDALRASEERFQQFMHHLPGRVFIKDIQDRTLYCNERYAQSLGRTRGEIIGKTSLDLFAPELAARFTQENDRVRKTAHPLEFKYTSVVDGVATHWLTTKFLIPQGDQPPLVGGMSLNVTKEREAEIALQEAHDLLEQRVVERTAELERAKDRIEAIVDHSGDGIVLLHLAHGIQQANYAFDQLLGVEPGSYLGTRFGTYFLPDAGGDFETVLQEVVASHQTHHIDAQARRPDGRMAAVEISVAPVNRSERAVENIVCIIRDISERKRLESALTQKFLELEAFFTVALDLLCIADLEGRFVKVNRAWEQILGYPAGELEGRSFMDFVHPEDRLSTLEAMAKLADQELVTNFVNRYRAHDGGYRFVEWRSHPYGSLIYASARDITQRKQMDDELRASEERYRTTLAVMSEGLVVQGPTGEIQYCNAAAEAILGLTAAQMMGRTSVDPRWHAVHEDGSNFPGETHPAMLSIRTGQSQLNVVMGVYKPNGELTWILINSQAFPDRNRQSYAAVTTFTDITALKRVEFQLQEKHREDLQMQAYLRALHEVTVQLTHAETLDDFYRCVVESGRKHFGFERMGLLLLDEEEYVRGTYGTDAAGNTVDEHDLHFTPNELTGILKQTLDRSQRFVFEEDAHLYDNFAPIGVGQNAVTALWNGGVLGWLAVDNAVEHKPIMPRQLDILALYGVTVGSLLARRHAERKAVELSQRLELATRAGGMGIWDWLVAEDRMVLDEGMLRIYGLGPEDRVGNSRRGDELVHPDDVPRVRREIAASIREVKPLDTEYRIVRPNGDLRYVKSNALTVTGKDGSIERLVGINLDITSIKLAEQALRSALEKEKEFGELRSRFVSMASHEFRTPLAAILATTETLTIYRARMDNTQIDGRLDRSRQQPKRMKEIMDDVLNLARIQSGRMEYVPASGDFGRLCAELVDEFDHQTEYHARINYQSPPTPVSLTFDKRLMRLVVSNLIHNALKYSGTDKPVYVRLSEDADSVTFEVRDQGIGIPPDDLRHLFEPFHRAKNVGAISGTGLGLSIAKQAVESHKGTVAVDTKVNGGTTFTIVLPKQTAANAEPE